MFFILKFVSFLMLKRLVAYFGLVRLYSLIDIILLLFAAGFYNFEFMGAIFLHLGFLAYLEYRHNHDYREAVPIIFVSLFLILGIIFYWHWEVILYLGFSYLYTLKNNKVIGLLSPFFRGLQHLFLIAAVTGYASFLPYLAFAALGIRNFAGDMRDVRKDKKERTLTIPILLGMKKGIKNDHLILILSTTLLWWWLSGLSVIYLIVAWIIQILTYNVTER